MSILRDFEKRLEGSIEGFFARAFRSGLQPVELAKAVQRYAGNYQQVGVDGVIVPNVYRFVLSPDDLERFGGYVTQLQRELAEVATRTATERGWQLKGRVRIEFEEGPQTRVGTYELRGKIEAKQATASAPSESSRVRVLDEPAEHPPPAPAPAPQADDSAHVRTTVMPSAAAARALLYPIGRGGPPSEVRDRATVGRLPECEVTLDDPSVSRRHARIWRADDVWRIEDLGSTNGLRVNGERVATTTLQDGDRIEFGSVRLAFAAEEPG